jgi:hypothetical protein
VTHFVDDRLSSRAKLLAAGSHADTSELDTEANLDLLRERLRHAGVADESEFQRTLQRCRLARDRTVGGIDAERSPFERDAELPEGLRPECGHGKDRQAACLRGIHIEGGLVALEFCDLERVIRRFCGPDCFVKRRHLRVEVGGSTDGSKSERQHGTGPLRWKLDVPGAVETEELHHRGSSPRR